jgi:hypothetical protein
MNILAFLTVWVCYIALLTGLLMLGGNSLFKAVVDANIVSIPLNLDIIKHYYR